VAGWCVNCDRCLSRSVRFFGFCRWWGEVGRFSGFFELNVPKAWQFFFFF
jgi:hypothetical protein